MEDGIELVSAMVWAEGSGRHARVTDAMVERRYERICQRGDIKQLHLLMSNWTDGTADKASSFEAHNGLNAWRGVYHQLLPEIERQQQLLMQEYTPKTATDLQDQKEKMHDMGKQIGREKKDLRENSTKQV